eukprot:9936130-Karenia_brevis.AAC.1
MAALCAACNARAWHCVATPTPTDTTTYIQQMTGKMRRNLSDNTKNFQLSKGSHTTPMYLQSRSKLEDSSILLVIQSLLAPGIFKSLSRKDT